MVQKIETYLREKYPAKRTLKEGEFQYIPGTPISEIPVKAYLNHLKFYKTQLQTAYFEFPTIDILLATATGNTKDIYLLKSLSFEPPDPRFLKLFEGCTAGSVNEKNELALGITTLLSAVAVGQQIEKIANNRKNEIIYRVNQANRSYIDFAFEFNEEGVLNNIVAHGN